jgi:hypothetical protein
MLKIVFLSAAVTLIGICKVFSQSADIDSLVSRMERYAQVHPSEILYLHLDKTIYSNNETIWFSAYLFNTTADHLKDHSLFSVALVNEENRKVEIQNRYPVYGGWGTGSLSIPDSIPPGNYQLVAMTNVLSNDSLPVALFNQPISIKNVKTMSVNTSLALMDTVLTENGVIRAKVRVEYPYDEKNRKYARLEYTIGKEISKPVLMKEYEYIITIPAEKLNQPDPVLTTTIKYNNDIRHLSIKLPALKADYINLRFFPEGGTLVNKLESRVAWEASTSHAQPVAVSGVLYEDNIPIDTIQTDETGIGIFKLRPLLQKKYSVRLVPNPYQKRDSVYQLPASVANGIVMHMPSALINDSLYLNILSTDARTVKAVVHNYNEVYAAFDLTLQPQTNRIIVPLPAISKGLATITILDHQSRPLCERIFFAHIDRKVKTAISIAKTSYEQKENVEVNLSFTDETGQPVEGIVSVAVVQDSRFDYEKLQDIETYLYLRSDLGALPHDGGGLRLLEQKSKLENVLLVKTWRRFTWQQMELNHLSPAPRNLLPAHHVQILKNKKQLSSPISVAIMRDSSINILQTNNSGLLNVTVNDLLVKEGRKVFALIAEKNKNNYTIDESDPFDDLQKLTAEKLEVSTRGRVMAIQKTKDWELDASEKVAVLQTAVVVANKSSYGGTSVNACGDYVCMYNILNCPNHYGYSGNKPPVTGYTYKSPFGGIVTYGTCVGDQQNPTLKGIYEAREFYGVEEDSLGIKGPQLLSTLFWAPGIILDSTGKAKFSFLTGDLAGRYRISVQGVSTEDVVVGESFFEVKK